MSNLYDVVIIGGGPAGLASAIASKEQDGNVLVIERENSLGGILKQCIHDGFGVTRFGERLSGPEYAYKDIEKVHALNIPTLTSTFVLDINKTIDGFNLIVSNADGIDTISTKAIILATGCRERTSKQIFITGTRPAGVFTAGCAQRLVNIDGLMPAKKVVILGSGDIGLIMARRLTLEGAQILGVYEVKAKPSGLNRNIAQCLNDFNIPLYLKKTVTQLHGTDRLEAVTIVSVDEYMNVIEGTEERLECDTLILSVGLIPENELGEKLGVQLSVATKGPIVDHNLHTSIPGVFAAGNALSVNDLVDYVSENGFIAGKKAMDYVREMKERNLINVKLGKGVSTVVPERIDLNSELSKTIFYLRSNNDYRNVKVQIKSGDKLIKSAFFKWVNQAESIRLVADLSGIEHEVEVEII